MPCINDNGFVIVGKMGIRTVVARKFQLDLVADIRDLACVEESNDVCMRDAREPTVMTLRTVHFDKIQLVALLLDSPNDGVSTSGTTSTRRLYWTRTVFKGLRRT